MSTGRQARRIGRRELHSARAVASVIVAVTLIIVLVWVGTETVLSAFGQRPLLAAPWQMAEWAAGLAATTAPAVLVTSGLLMALAGLVLILAGVLPGRRARHQLARDRATVIVDDAVIAAALSKVARQRGRLVPEQVTTTISARTITILIRPTSGIALDRDGIEKFVEAEAARYGLHPGPRLAVRVSEQGAVGV
ncbi:hypothetical protein [Pseudarthrobacter sp. NBSH8]|uniref:hypothetical protein n=1 Tax=Pseudarthrobacter sp. NBSH8 TaxID=2596911 RepID=UPI00162A3427|nr:hypothetical protein [Pseudarthrobacter sp. NBSH8]QNE14586.1 hypothetical protein FYJ92_09250 [Pseudarthrobacter sp. NBSH8]